jgi:hypothetical protein
MKGRFSLVIASILMILGLVGGFSLLARVYDGPVWIELIVIFAVLFVTVCLIVSLKRFFDATNENKK